MNTKKYALVALMGMAAVSLGGGIGALFRAILWKEGEIRLFFAYDLLSPLLGLLAAFAGMQI